MARRWFATAAIGALALGVAACDGKIPGYGSGGANGVAVAPAAPAPVEIGGPLYTPEDTPKSARPATNAPVADPIVIQGAQITVPSTENVPTKNNGKLWQICTDWTPDTPEKDVFVHPNDPTRKFKRLREGDVVKAGQLVALLDDEVAKAKRDAAVTDKAASEKMLVASLTVADKALKTFEVYKQLVGGAGSKVELYKAEQEWAASVKQAADAEGTRDKNIEAEKIANVQLREHELRATISGTVKTIYRKPGEAVKELEPVLQIQNLDQLRVEGMLPVQYLPLLPNLRGKTVMLQPSAQLAPQQELPGHLLAVTGVAVSKDAKKPMIVTCSEDKSVRVWDRATKFQKAIFQHDVPMRAVTTTGAKSSLNLGLSGGDDGVGRIYDLDNLSTTDGVRKLKSQHRGRVNTVAFSPDGTFCATADDKEIFITDTTSGELKYKIPSEHKGPITSIQFTPQCKLLSTARDRSIRVWDLGEKAAKVTSVIENRSGNVDVLGVSPDGQRVLFDQDKALHVRGIYDQRTEAELPAPTDSSQFSSFAIFAPDSNLVMAAGTGDNPLSLWRLPAAGSTRGFQRVRLALSGSHATCAAFSTDGVFAVVGTADHRLLVFARPERADLEKQYPATVTFLDQSVDSTDRKVRLWAELPNPGMPLLPGDSVTVVVPAPAQ